jgi:hypothetical protein
MREQTYERVIVREVITELALQKSIAGVYFAPRWCNWRNAVCEFGFDWQL